MIRYFIDHPRLVFVIIFGVLIAGIVGMLTIRREAFPSVNIAQAIITTRYPGASPQDVEELVTKRIEDALKEVDGIEKIRSVSAVGISIIHVEVDIDRPDDRAILDEIQRKVMGVQGLPSAIPDAPHYLEINTKLMPVFEMSLVGDASEHVLRQSAKDLKQNLENIQGVAIIEMTGDRDREYIVYLDPHRMNDLHVSLDEVKAAIAARNVNMAAGIFASRPHEMTVRTVGAFESADEILDVVIRTNFSGEIIYVKDVAEVEDGFKRPTLLTRANGQPSILLTLKKQETADFIRVSDRVKAALADFEKHLPEGVSLIITNDESIRTRDRINITLNNGLMGFALIILVLVGFLSFRMAFLSAMAVPIIVMMSLVYMTWTGLSFNVITMLGIVIALGMFIDNSIVITENIYRLKEQGMPILDAARHGVGDIWGALTATVLTTIAAFAPLLFTSGIMGKFIWTIPAIVSVSLLCSLVDSFFLLPTRIAVIGGGAKPRELRWFNAFRKAFERMIARLIRFRWITVPVAGIILVGFIMLAVFKMDFVLFPKEGGDRLIVGYESVPGTPIEVLHEEVKKYEAVIAGLPEEELRDFITYTGFYHNYQADIMPKSGDTYAMTNIYLTPENTRRRGAEEIAQYLETHIERNHIMDRVFIEQQVMGPPLGRPVSLTILGNDLPALYKHAEDIQKIISEIPHTCNVSVDQVPGLRQLRVKVRDLDAANVGLTVAQVAEAVRTAQDGAIVSAVVLFDEDIGIRVQLSDQARGDLEALDDLLIADRRGNLIPLRNVADVIDEEGPRVRRHYSFQRSITISAEIDDEHTTAVKVNQVLSRQLRNFEHENPGLALVFGGEQDAFQKSMGSLAQSFIIALMGIFIILLVLFNSFSKALLIMVPIPFGFIGTILGFYLQGKPLGFLALFGVVGLAGVVINASIVLVTFIEQLRKENDGDLISILAKAAGMRLRPIMLTTITAVLALFPMAYGIGGWDPILVPMTMAMAWGLLFGTGLTLIILPCTYAIIEDLIGRRF